MRVRARAISADRFNATKSPQSNIGGRTVRLFHGRSGFASVIRDSCRVCTTRIGTPQSVDLFNAQTCHKIVPYVSGCAVSNRAGSLFFRRFYVLNVRFPLKRYALSARNALSASRAVFVGVQKYSELCEITARGGASFLRDGGEGAGTRVRPYLASTGVSGRALSGPNYGSKARGPIRAGSDKNGPARLARRKLICGADYLFALP